MSLKRISSLTALLCMFVIISNQSVKAAVDLVSFTAVAQAQSILIEWETATEINNAGFYVTRNTSSSPPFEPVSGFIVAEGSGVVGAEYQFVDDDVTNGQTYYYYLEAVDTSQSIEMHGPISVTFNLAATLTPTSTNTPTATDNPTTTNTPSASLTPSATSEVTSTPSKTPHPQHSLTPTKTPTPTRTRTSVPANTSTSAPPTISPTMLTHTPTISATPTNTPSPTLIEAPEIVLVLPSTNTPIPTVTISPHAPSPTQTQKAPINQFIESKSILMVTVICLVFLVWAVIAVGIFIYIQKRNI